MKSKLRGIPLDCLSLKALQQLRDLGYDVSKATAAKTSAVLLQRPPASRANKFGVSSTELRTEDGIVFASKLEASSYRFLRDRNIPFERQVAFELEEAFEHEGKKYRNVRYVCDFVLDPNGKRLILDLKGVKLPVYLLKKKLMLKKFGIHIQEIRSLQELALLLHSNGLM